MKKMKLLENISYIIKLNDEKIRENKKQLNLLLWDAKRTKSKNERILNLFIERKEILKESIKCFELQIKLLGMDSE